MVAFCIKEAMLSVQRIGSTLACPGKVCNGLYDNGTCPCHRITQLPKVILNTTVVIKDVSESLGLRIQPFQSNNLTEFLIGQKAFEVIAVYFFFNINNHINTMTIQWLLQNVFT